jgi:hypothetical protein
MSDTLSSTHARSRRLSDSDTTTTTIPLSKPTMLGRLRRSSSLSATDTQYHALPQSPDIAQDINIPSAIEEGGMTAEEIDDPILDDEHVPPNAPVDSRIQWIHFILGSAVLLPWNGASQITSWCVARPDKRNSLSHDHRRAVFPLAITTFLHSKHLFLISRNNIHALQLCFPRSRDINVKEGNVSCSPPPLAPTFLWVLIEWSYRSTLIDGRDGQCSVLLCSRVSSQ